MAKTRHQCRCFWLPVLGLIATLSGPVTVCHGLTDPANVSDLLDLYVQHMDETMLTGGNQNRTRRSVIESPYYRPSDPVGQSIDQSRRPVKNSRTNSRSRTRNHEVELQEGSFSEVVQSPNQKSSPKTNPKSHRSRPKFVVPKKWRPNGYKRWKKPSKTQQRRVGNKARARRQAAGVHSQLLDDGVVMAVEPPKPPTPASAATSSERFLRSEWLDDEGQVLLEWDPTGPESGLFRVTARTLGYVALGFNDRGSMIGADMLVIWIDDETGTVNVLDSHGPEEANGPPQPDASQDARVIRGAQNNTHTSVTFMRSWRTCDTHDRHLTGDTVRVLWALHPSDPEFNVPAYHEERRGVRALRLRAAAAHPEPANRDQEELVKWDVKLNQYSVSNTSDTIYWCKIFKAPRLDKKHHIVGYTPLVEKANAALVHHVILYECASTNPILAEHARLAGAKCYTPLMPKEWDSCLQPVVVWARGSAGEWMPRHVGLPIAENSYYMLEVHYNNYDGNERRVARKPVIDSSGVRLHLSPRLRTHEAGILATGVAVSPLHMIPPGQREYATAGYCTESCTNRMFPEDGINVVSVVLHAHLAGRRLSLRHVRDGKELPPIVRDDKFNFDYQQTHTLDREAKVLPGDQLVTECVYETRHRTKPTFGGYAATQEMCLAFVVYYPKTQLGACYSMTPVKEFFNALNVQSFKDISLEKVEKLFLTTTAETQPMPVTPLFQPPDDDMDEDDIIKQTKYAAYLSEKNSVDYKEIFERLFIERPSEFKDHSLADHMAALPWNDTALSKSFEENLYKGNHATFCRKRDDKFPLETSIRTFPSFTELPEQNDTTCSEYQKHFGSLSNQLRAQLILVAYITLIIYFIR